MSDALARVRDLFLAPPAETAPAVQVAERAVATTIGVLCAGSAAPVAGTALALVAAARAGSACAVVCRWRGEGGATAPSGVALPSARRLAGRLAARGMHCGARGRVVTVELPGEPVAARAAAERVAAAAGDAPVVLVVAGARSAVFDPLLAAQERLVVVPPADGAEGLEALAVAEAARLGRSAGVLRLPAGGAARALTAGGMFVGPALRTAAHAALDGHAA